MLETSLPLTPLLGAYYSTRQYTLKLCEPLLTEDYVIQSIEDVSPPKWHLAHTTWFFETFILVPYLPNYKVFHPLFAYLFNSYYQGIGEPYPRAKRGVLSRPTVETIYAYRDYVDQWIGHLLTDTTSQAFKQIENLLILGLQHEQQHQELLLTDIKYNFSLDPTLPPYQHSAKQMTSANLSPLEFVTVEPALVAIGYDGNSFCFDNELPRHQTYISPFAIAKRLITNEEYLEFINAGGYRDPQYWLAEGWDNRQKLNINAPLYWHDIDNEWHIFTLQGLQPLDLREPVAHVSFYEAEAYARFAGARLPNEAEWEYYATINHLNPEQGNFLESENYHPTAANKNDQQFFGDVWEWTASAYRPYPGFKPQRGILGEYNGKFMSNQMVLRGGSCLTPALHMRSSYRNFFPPDKRWQFTGIRLAKDIEG